MLAVVDTGPLYAALDQDDDDHEACAAALRRPDLRLAVPVLVVAEVTDLAATRLGAEVEATLSRPSRPSTSMRRHRRSGRESRS
jgi:predicted nucleic acid-binding protein